MLVHSSHIISKLRCSHSESHGSSRQARVRRPSLPMENDTQRFMILMRHGMTDWNHDGRIQGSLDRSRLNTTGMKQARRAGKFLSGIPIDNVLCSPLHRARQTLELVASVSQNPRLQRLRPELLDDLKEIQVPWQGGLRSEISSGHFRETYASYKRNPHTFSYYGFSPLNDLVRRAELVWDTIMRSNGQFQLVVAHNQMNKALICTALGMETSLASWNQSNCCFNLFVLHKGRPPILRLCNGSVLEDPSYAPRRSFLRSKWTRVYIHHSGPITGLRREIRRAPISYLFCVNHKVDDLDLVALGKRSLKKKYRTVYIGGEDITSMYQACRELLNNIRNTFVDRQVIVSVNSSRVHSLFFVAALGRDANECRRFHSDSGGVSIIDLSSLSTPGPEGVRVECFNTHANSSSGPLLGYTFGIDMNY